MTSPTAPKHNDNWSQQRSSSSNHGENFPDLTDKTDKAVDAARAAASSAADSARSAISSAAETARDAAHTAREVITDAAGDAREALSGASERAGEVAEKAVEAGKDGFAKLEEFVRANPIPVLVGTAAAGAILAMVVANRNRSSSSSTRKIMREMSRAGSDMQDALRRELRTAMNEERINRIVNSLPTNDVSKALSPWISQAIEALTSAKNQAQSAVANAAGKVQDKLS